MAGRRAGRAAVRMAAGWPGPGRCARARPLCPGLAAPPGRCARATAGLTRPATLAPPGPGRPDGLTWLAPAWAIRVTAALSHRPLKVLIFSLSALIVRHDGLRLTNSGSGPHGQILTQRCQPSRLAARLPFTAKR